MHEHHDRLKDIPETVKSPALSLESVDNIERCDCLTLGMLSVSDSITDDTFEERLQNTTGLFVNHCQNMLVSHCRTAIY